MIIKLSEAEMRLAITIGTERNLQSLLSGRKDAHGKKSDGGWTEHIEGAGGELATAKCLEMYWGGTVNTFKNADLKNNIQVRTRSRLDYDLIIRDDDRDDHIFVLVLGQSPVFDVVGAILGKDGKNSKWRRSYGGREPAFFVPKSELILF